MKVLVTGASGFVGGHVVAALVAAGHNVVGLSRSMPSFARRHDGVKYYAGVDVGDFDTVHREPFTGVDAVVHLVGVILERRPNQTFQRIHVDGTSHVLTEAKRAGVKRFIYLSAIGSSPGAKAKYSRTKFEAEKLVQGSGIPYVILRPSIILGRDGEFVAQMRDLVRYGGLPIHMPFPVIPVPGSGNNRFQPIYIDDLTACITRSLTDDALTNKTIELGGSTRVTFNKLIDAFASAERIKKPKLHAPIPLLSLVAPLVELLPKPPFSGDQLKNLSTDNITDITPMRKAFGIEPLDFEESMARVYGKQAATENPAPR